MLRVISYVFTRARGEGRRWGDRFCLRVTLLVVLRVGMGKRGKGLVRRRGVEETRGNKISSVVIASLLLGQQQNEYRAGCKLRLALFWANFSFRPKKKEPTARERRKKRGTKVHSIEEGAARAEL